MGSVRRRDAGRTGGLASAEPRRSGTPWLLAVADASPAMQEEVARPASRVLHRSEAIDPVLCRYCSPPASPATRRTSTGHGIADRLAVQDHRRCVVRRICRDVLAACGSPVRVAAGPSPPGRGIERREGRRRPQGPSAREGKKNHPCGLIGRPGRRSNRLLIQQSHTGPCRGWAGIVWRTSAHKGSPFLRRRAPAPNTADHKGSPDGSHRQAIGGPFAAGGGMQTRRTRGVRFAEKPPSGPAAGGGWTGRAHGQRALRAGRPQGMRDTGHAADSGHGSRGSGGQSSAFAAAAYASARRHAWACRFRPAACLCSRGSDCTTRSGPLLPVRWRVGAPHCGHAGPWGC